MIFPTVTAPRDGAFSWAIHPRFVFRLRSQEDRSLLIEALDTNQVLPRPVDRSPRHQSGAPSPWGPGVRIGQQICFMSPQKKQAGCANFLDFCQEKWGKHTSMMGDQHQILHFVIGVDWRNFWQKKGKYSLGAGNVWKCKASTFR